MRSRGDVLRLAASGLSWFWGAAVSLIAVPKLINLAEAVRSVPAGEPLDRWAAAVFVLQPAVDLAFGAAFCWVGYALKKKSPRAPARALLVSDLFLLIYLVTGLNFLENFVGLGLVVVPLLIFLVLAVP